jgi:hypothetical protein
MKVVGVPRVFQKRKSQWEVDQILADRHERKGNKIRRSKIDNNQELYQQIVVMEKCSQVG